ncbi:MAG: hypothetical protein KDI88_00495 [Gammaproteobacteria bacterium]|nr:hypothetical protein [Gammaproteobacteria bacterium]
MTVRAFTLQSYLWRFLFALVLVFATYNPSGYSYYHWAKQNLGAIDPLVVLAGVALLIGWVMFIRATLRSLGPIGILLAVAFFGTIVWLVIDRGWLEADDVQMITYLGLFLLSAILATGMSWSHIRRRMSGQLDVDEIEDNN